MSSIDEIYQEAHEKAQLRQKMWNEGKAQGRTDTLKAVREVVEKHKVSYIETEWEWGANDTAIDILQALTKMEDDHA